MVGSRTLCHALVRIVAVVAFGAAARTTCPTCTGTPIVRHRWPGPPLGAGPPGAGPPVAVIENVSEYACLDASTPSNMFGWLAKRDMSETGMFGIGASETRAVTVNIIVKSLWGISEKAQDYNAKLELSLNWLICDLVWDGSTAAPSGAIVETTKAELIWSPTIGFNELRSRDVPTEADSTFYVMMKNGRFIKTSVVIGTFSCSMAFRLLPFDTQTCRLVMEVLGQSAASLVLVPGTVKLPSGGLPNNLWDIQDFRLADEVITKDLGGQEIPYSTLMMEFSLVRKPDFYFVSVQSPVIVIWALSHAGLYVPITALPARAALAVIPVLCMINTQSRVISTLPPISYFTVLDLYLLCVETILMCNMLVLGLISHSNVVTGRLKKDRDSRSAEAGVEEAPVPGMNRFLEALGSPHFEGWYRMCVLFVFILVNILYQVKFGRSASDHRPGPDAMGH